MKIDLVLKNGWVFRTYRQCFELMDIAIVGDKVYHVSPSGCEGNAEYDADQVIDCTGQYIVPGLVDIHMHVESSMTVPGEFARVVLPYGVTTVVSDPHEIANVFGLEGIACFMEQETELDIFYGIPSCVPSTNLQMETSGGEIGAEEVGRLLEEEKVLCLGEVMNFKALTSEEDTKIKEIIGLCKENGRNIRIEGHCPSISGEDLAKFVYAGVDADHTQQTPESVLEKADMGMFLELQAKSLTKEVVAAVNHYHLYETVALVTDDTMPDDLVNKGQLDRILRLAVENGMPMEKAIYCSTLTPARRMHLDDRGMIAPGKLADLVILSDLKGFVPAAVYKKGKPAGKEPLPTSGGGCRNGSGSVNNVKKNFPAHFYNSVKCRPAELTDFILEVTKGQDRVLVHVMQIQKVGTTAKLVKREVEVREGRLCWQEAGLCLAAVFERHGKTGEIAYGLVEHGFTEKGAVATTWSHDSHNLLVLGNSPEAMVTAQREVLRLQGGYVVAAGAEILAEAGLMVGGIVSDGPLKELAEEVGRVRRAIEGLGYENSNVIMSVSTLTLLVSPEVKLSDKGLYHVKTQEKLPLIASYPE